MGFVTSYSFTIYNARNPTTRYGLISRNGTSSLDHNTNGSVINSKALPEVGAPAGTVLFFEFYGADSGYSRFVAGMRSNNGDVAWTGPTGWTDFPQTIDIGNLCGDGMRWLYTMGSHNGVMNVGFMDGHAKGVKRGTLMRVNPANGIWDGSRPNRLHFDEQFH